MREAIARTAAEAPVVVVTPPGGSQPDVPVQADGPPPTQARPAQTDPNAPIVTRPQKLD